MSVYNTLILVLVLCLFTHPILLFQYSCGYITVHIISLLFRFTLPYLLFLYYVVYLSHSRETRLLA